MSKKKYIYARVSSNHQKQDLERQVNELTQAYPDHEVITDIGSGINFKRKGLETILEHVLKEMVQEVVVAYKDRLCRFGYDLIDFIFRKTNTTLLVHSKRDDIQEFKDDQKELAEDLLAITTVFVARNNGRRSAINKKRRHKLQITENQNLPKHKTETIV